MKLCKKFMGPIILDFSRLINSMNLFKFFKIFFERKEKFLISKLFKKISLL
jgi:hypothetical protein